MERGIGGGLSCRCRYPSATDPAYGKLGLDLMRAGKNAPETLAGLVASDPANAVRQVAMIDAQGRLAAHTGTATIA